MSRKLLPLVLSALFLSGCTQHTRVPQQSDLLHHHFVLKQVDGKAFKGEAMEPGIEFGEKLHISGSMCNRFMGQGELNGGTLKVSRLTSTRRACIDPQRAALDDIISNLLQSGAKISLDNGVLTLSNERHTLLYQQKEWM